MGDPRRFDVMAEAVAARWPDRSLAIADIAAGKGYLHAALYRRGYRNVVCFERRVKKQHRAHFRREFLNEQTSGCFDLALAMHPDAATDHTIAFAARYRIPFAIVPCCVMPSAYAFDGRDYHDWCRHLTRLGHNLGAVVEPQLLPMQGRNLMLVGWFA